MKFPPSTLTYYRQHQKCHTKPFECKHCSKCFGSHSDWSRHVHNKHRIGLHMFTCPVIDCNFKTKRKDNLGQHVCKRRPTKSKQSQAILKERPPLQAEVDQIVPEQSDITNDSIPLPIGHAFMEAASTGNVSMLNHMLQGGVDVDTKAGDGYTALHCAAMTGQTEAMKFLLKKGAIVDTRNSESRGRRPVHNAIGGKHAKAFAILLDAGADILLPDDKSHTVIDHVGSVGDVQVAQILFAKAHEQLCESEIASQLVLAAAKAGKSDLMKWLLSNFPEAVTHPDKVMASPIHAAVRLGHGEVLGILLSASKASNATNPNFVKAISRSLAAATAREATTMVRMLLECESVNINSESQDRETSLHIAAKIGHVGVLKLLLGHSKINSQCKSLRGQMPLELALLNCNWEALRLLANHDRDTLELGFEFLEEETLSIISDKIWKLVKCLLEREFLLKAMFGWGSFFERMVRMGATKVVKLLLEQPWFIVNEQLHFGRWDTVLHIAAQHHRHEIFCLLLGHPQIDVNKSGGFIGDNVLHYAVEYDNIVAVQLLLARPELNLTSVNDYGITALELARTLERHEMVSLLSKHGTSASPREAFVSATVNEDIISPTNHELKFPDRNDRYEAYDEDHLDRMLDLDDYDEEGNIISKRWMDTVLN
jgi:ankyrin repeat protein